MIRPNKLKRRLAAGDHVVGTFIKITDPAIIEVLGICGLDFFVLDLEHIAMNNETMTSMVRAAELTDIVPIVRVQTNNPIEVLHALDAGALGVQAPQINTLADAQALARSAKYGPEGDRGYAPTGRAAGYDRALDPQEYARVSNAEIITVAYCETSKAIANLPGILTVDGIDVIFIGPYDLSQSLGVTGQAKHPRVEQAIERIIDLTRKAGKAVGTIAGSAAEARRLIERGVQYITISSDLGMIAHFTKKALDDVKR